MPIKVYVRNKDLDTALKVFKSKVYHSGILQEYQDRQFYTKPSAVKYAKKRQWRSKKSS